ncbi:MAG TPA: DUF308 domain-containing protein, partial [Thermomicrobiales bacterium]|nr:DUF308 domain-containing protein [Thermomicrobiales bacterium]
MRWPWLWSRWIALGIGIAAIVVGASLTLRPFTSLDALTAFIAISLILVGVGDLVADRIMPAMLPTRLIGLVLLATGVVAFTWPDATIRAVAIIAGIGILLGGIVRIGIGLLPGIEDRYVLLVGGAAGVIFGVLALAWQDVTILAIALMVGPFVVIYGVGQIVRALRAPGPVVIRF